MSAATGKPVQELKVLELFAEALDLCAEEREDWLARTCAGDSQLHDRVRALLAIDATAHESTLSGESPVVPEQIGHYRLEEWVGSGGMGSVYRAQRVDGLFEQTVAIKFVRQPRGLENLQPLIEAERRTLARMDHPGIARILDGGETGQGLQYLIMEFVRGVPLNHYLSAHRTPLRERVRLFREVCAAVGHAHEHLVLHCDLKPENILVDQEGRARLIDFGVARLKDVIDPQRPDGYTRGYTSPQRMQGLPATVTDDIYALGKVLDDCIGPNPEDIDAGRELRAIGGKASAEKREDRYPTVAALDADLAAWIELRPVSAVDGDLRYRLRKLMQRHPWRLISAGGAVFALIAALIIISAQYARAERARADAERRFSEVRSLASFVLFDLYDRLSSLSQSLALRRDVAATGQHYLSILASDVTAPTALQVEALEGLLRLSSVQGGNSGAQLGQIAEAHESLMKADTIATRLESRGLVAWRLAQLRAEILLQQVHLYADLQNDLKAADQRLTAARAQLDRALADPAHEPGVIRTHLEWYRQAATVRLWEGRYDDAMKLAREGQRALSSLPSAAATDRAGRVLEGTLYDLIATATFYAGDHRGAIPPYQRELEVLEATAAALPSDVEITRSLARARWALGTTFLDVGRAADALPLTNSAMNAARQLVARDVDDNDARRLQSMTELAYAQALAANGATADALSEFGAIIERRRLASTAQPRNASLTRAIAIALFARGDVYSDAGQPLDACRDYRAGFETFEQLRTQGLLTQLDNDYALKQARQRAEALHCAAPGS